MLLRLAPIGVFIVALAWGLVGARQERWSSRHWLKLEYVWRGIAALTVGSLIVSADAFLARGELPSQDGWRRTAWELVASDCRTFGSWFKDGGVQSSLSTDPVGGEPYRRFTAWCDSLVQVADTQDEMMLDELTRVSRVGVGDDAFLQELAGRVLRAATIVRKQSTATARLRERAAGQPWDTVIRVLAFLLLPIALALPIAKVTAGLRGWIPDDPR